MRGDSSSVPGGRRREAELSGSGVRPAGAAARAGRLAAALAVAVMAGVATNGAAQAGELSVDGVVARYLEARGGRARLAAVRSLLATGRLVSGAGESRFTLLWVCPDRARLEMVTGRRTMIEVVSGERAWWVAPDASPPQSGLLPVDATREIVERGDVGGILAHYAERGYAATLAGEDGVDGQPAVTLRLTRGDETHLVSLSLASFLPLRRSSNWGRQGLGKVIEARFSGFRTVDGVVVPFAIERRAGGELLHRVVVERVGFDVAVEEAAFAPPAELADRLASP